MELLFLADFSVIRPEPGLIIWTLFIFIVFWLLMARFAFRPIQNALKKREQDIQDSLDEAKHAREEMANLKAENEDLLKQAREERSKILREANQARDNIVNEAKSKAKDEARKIVEEAKEQIEHMKAEALTDARNQIGVMSIEIAEKVLRKQLDDKQGQQAYVDTLVGEMKFNNQ